MERALILDTCSACPRKRLTRAMVDALIDRPPFSVDTDKLAPAADATPEETADADVLRQEEYITLSCACMEVHAQRPAHGAIVSRSPGRPEICRRRSRQAKCPQDSQCASIKFHEALRVNM